MRTLIPGEAACILALLVLGQGLRGVAQEPPPSPNSPDDPLIGLELDVSRPELSPDQIAVLEMTEKSFSNALERQMVALDPARAAGLAAGSQPELLDLRLVLVLAALRAGEPDAPFRSSAADLLQRAGAAGLDDPSTALEVLRKHPEAIASIRLDFETLDSFQAARQAGIRVFALERALEIYRVYADGSAAAMISVSALRRIEAAALEARDDREGRLADYRDRLDALKARLGLTPEAEVAIDPAALAGFEAGIAALTALEADPDWSVERLYGLVDQFPAPADFKIGGESAEAVVADPSRLEPFLRASANAAVNAAGLAPGADADRVVLRVRKAARRLVEARARFERGRQLLRFADLERNATLQLITAPPGIEDLRDQDRHTQEFILDGSGSEARRRLVSDWIAAATARVELVALTGAIHGEDWDAFLDAFTTMAPDAVKPPG